MGYLNKILMAVALLAGLFLVGGDLAKAVETGTKTEAVVCDLSKVTDDRGAIMYPNGNPSWFLPDCVYFEGTVTQKQCGCRNINVFIQLLINVANKILMVVGGVALLVFIYGGFLILTAAGGENVKKGKETLVAAVIGLIIIFSAQLLLNFVLDIVVIKAGGAKDVTVQGVQVNVPTVK